MRGRNMGKRVFIFLTIISLATAILFGTMIVSDTLAAESILKLDQKWTGDFDGMVKKRVIRALVWGTSFSNVICKTPNGFATLWIRKNGKDSKNQLNFSRIIQNNTISTG